MQGLQWEDLVVKCHLTVPANTWDVSVFESKCQVLSELIYALSSKFWFTLSVILISRRPPTNHRISKVGILHSLSEKISNKNCSQRKPRDKATYSKVPDFHGYDSLIGVDLSGNFKGNEHIPHLFVYIGKTVYNKQDHFLKASRWSPPCLFIVSGSPSVQVCDIS